MKRILNLNTSDRKSYQEEFFEQVDAEKFHLKILKVISTL